ncbi:MAG: ComF family protein [Candidatus Thioglobus sp.]|nr:MAG: ComF family protein [Candidatus Thioglobus sp.]KAA0449621.1 MAG: ComF family protein [Candidatus Thioglobus sp.]
MGIYQRLAPKQACILCLEQAQFCVCPTCSKSFSNHPNRCQSCAAAIGAQLDFCGQCLTHSPAFDRAHTLYDYQGDIAELIKIFKYDGKKLCIGDYFSRQLYDLYQTLPAYDAIIPMPLSKERVKVRGFNQVLELLRQIKRKTPTIIDIHSVKRIKATRQLFELNLEQRRAEIKGAFIANPMPYQKVLLVDDIITTGSSLNELATTILKTTSVTHCDVMTLARAIW